MIDTPEAPISPTASAAHSKDPPESGVVRPEERTDSNGADDRAEKQKTERPKRVIVLWCKAWRYFKNLTHFLHQFDGWVTAIATVVLAVLTCSLARYASNQETIIKQQRADAIAVQRAFIVASRLEITPYKSPEGKITGYLFRPIVRNSGTTPTRNLEAVYSDGPSGGTDVNIAEIFDPDAPFATSFRIKTVVGPNDEADGKTYYRPIELLDKMQNGEIVTTISGSIHYDDIFEGSPHHITKYCFAVILQKPSSGGLDFNTWRCQKWNCADNECKAD